MRTVFSLLALLIPSLAVVAESPPDFNRDVLPILSDKCLKCHGPDIKARRADLRLDVKASVMEDRGGYAVVVPGKPQESELIRRIKGDSGRRMMPPRRSKLTLSQEEIDILSRWVESGATWERHWAFVPPRRPAPPEVKGSDRPRNAIDPFIRARLEREGMAPSREADKAALLRRVTFDLTGLPPPSEEIDAFLKDSSPDAYEKVVDRLLASPRYGEHMSMAWLEAGRYADTDGYQNDRIRYMSPWRDWVIRALNRNMPFDRFTLEQFAGDLLPDATLSQQIATGFHRNHRINSEAGSIVEEFHVENVVDRVDTTATVWLGLTMACARCHDHKFDPIMQKEYYQLFAFFNNIQEWGIGPNNGNSPPFVKVPENWPHLSPEQDRFFEPKPYTIKVVQGNVPRPNPGGPETAMVLHELDKPRKTYRLNRGEYDKPDKSEELRPETPEVLGLLPEDLPRNRLGLAKWLTSPSNPLTARVIANRAWQRFFGTGLVKTSENFGLQGEKPSHPQLLDWLATELHRSGWDMKRLHRLIVTSATYRQAKGYQPRDPENRLLSHGPSLKLTAAMLRDQALAAGGLLVEQVGGPSVKPYMPPGLWKSISNNRYQQDHGEKLYRRSLYTYWRRTIPPPTMVSFGAANREACSVRSTRTDTPMQALTLMNNITFVEAARMLAERMIREGGDNAVSRLKLGFSTVTSREPSAEQLGLLRRALSTFERRFREDPDRAELLLKVGEHPVGAGLDPIEVASYAMVGNLLLSMDVSVRR